MDRHDFWRHVEHDFEHALERRPAGFVPVAIVHVAGRAEPLEVSQVETRKTQHGTMLRLQSGWDSEEGSSAIPPGTWFYHAPAVAVIGAEVVYKREGTVPVGFVVTEYEPAADEGPRMTLLA